MIFRYYILIAVLLFSSVWAGAQDNNYVYRDTAILYADSLEAATNTAIKATGALALDENETDESYVGYLPDTVISNNNLVIETDSVKALKNQKPFAYAKNLDSLLIAYQQSLQKNQLSSKNKMSWLERFLLSPFTQYFFWLLAVVFVAVILFKLFFAEGFFQRSYAKAVVTAMPDESGHLSNNADYDKLITLAVSKGNYRAAVRYHYLQTLQKLTLKGIIQFAPDKTNYQYVNEMSGKLYKTAFASLTLHYEYVWYGEFEIDDIIFGALQNKFKQFNNGV